MKCVIIHELSSRDIKVITPTVAVEVNDHTEASAGPLKRKLDIASKGNFRAQRLIDPKMSVCEASHQETPIPVKLPHLPIRNQTGVHIYI